MQEKSQYVVTFYLREQGDYPHDTSFEYTTSSKEAAVTLAKEIMDFRESGKKTSLMLQLEQENYGSFRQDAGSVVYVHHIRVKRIVALGGIFSTGETNAKEQSNVEK